MEPWSGEVHFTAPAMLPSEKFYNLLSIPSVRRAVAISDLTVALHETLEQQAEVIASRSRGEKGPWTFGEVEWKPVEFF